MRWKFEFLISPERRLQLEQIVKKLGFTVHIRERLRTDSAVSFSLMMCITIRYSELLHWWGLLLRLKTTRSHASFRAILISSRSKILDRWIWRKKFWPLTSPIQWNLTVFIVLYGFSNLLIITKITRFEQIPFRCSLNTDISNTEICLHVLETRNKTLHVMLLQENNQWCSGVTSQKFTI